LIDIGPKLFQAEGRVIQENICQPALTVFVHVRYCPG
jgi:hypothetical protein